MKNKKKEKTFWEMTNAERDAMVKQYDKPIRLEDTRPLTAAERARWRRARRGPVYSLRVYNGKQRTIRVRVDEYLLKKFDEFAKRNRMTRDELITRSFRIAIAFVD
jgi:hypothetical protein